jgi:type II secretory pathway component GspD/PulD (secretin)
MGSPVVDAGANVFGLPGRRMNTDGYNIAYMYNFTTAFFDYLVSKGRAKVMTQPCVTVLDSETGEFVTGEQILYYRVQHGAAPAAGAREPGTPIDPLGVSDLYPDNRTVTGSLMDREIGVAHNGVTLEVTPVVAENAILLDLNISLASQLGYDDTGAPKLSSREVTTEINATPGQEYLIGGMTRTRSIQTTAKIPVLGSLPVIGWLFGKEITTTQKTMIAIALSADVVDNYSGLGADENSTINAVESEGMDSIPLPKTPVGYDMWLMDGLAE